jgi:TIR domain
MAKVFISYRRQDTGQIVASLYNFIAEAFGSGNVFVDTKNIPEGNEFPLTIQQNLRDASVMLVLIGNYWLGTKNDGRRRIDEPDDLVRAEVRLGLELARQRHLTLIPVLVDDAAMPESQQLPADLAQLHWLNAAHVHSSLTYFTNDINRLLEDINNAGMPRQVQDRLTHAPDRFSLLIGAGVVVDEGGPLHPSPPSSSRPPALPAAPPSLQSPVPPALPATTTASYSTAPSTAAGKKVTVSVPAPASLKGKDILEIILGLLLELPGLVKAGIVLLVIVAVVSGVQHVVNPPLTEHSTCQQFQGASDDAQTAVLNQMMIAHGTPSNQAASQLSGVRLSVGFYCNVMGPNAPIDGIYRG